MDLRKIKIWGFITLAFAISCSNEPTQTKKDVVSGPLFTNIPSAQSKVFFKNEITETMDFNFIRYTNIYNGGGVALGDINNDGRPDIYLTSNQQTNKLYLNKGNFEFEDITVKAGVSDNKGWTTGVTMFDINNDGLLDIYVCKSGSLNNNEERRNKLYINQGNSSFKELARVYGIDDFAYSTQAYFFDYDKDGDNDMYLVNHRVDFENNIRIDASNQNRTSALTTDKLYQNQDGKFVDVTQAAGLLNNTWGHSAAIADYNEDGWLDLYICNDFIQGDQLWINNQKGGFTNNIHQLMDHTSFFSMGSDIADINNDSKPDLIVLDMVSEDHIANKKNMAAMSTEQFHQLVGLGHHYQYMSNVLQLNRGDGMFSDIALASGVANTDWSWAPLFADFDNDGYKDLFITNGIKRDMTDNDYKIALDKRAAQGQMTLDDLFGLIPSRKIKNYIYRNNGNGLFDKKTDEWGLTQYLNSNGAAYGDLDNDGDLDLVLNNIDDYASIYQNNASNNSLKIKLKGSANNPMGIGATIKVTSTAGEQHYQYFLSRGYQSSVAPDIIIGLGTDKNAKKVEINWPDGKVEILTDVPANKPLTLEYKNARGNIGPTTSQNKYFAKVNTSDSNLNFSHQENEYDDFLKEILLPHKYSTQGPNIVKGDVNGDGLDDLFIGGAKGQASKLFLQNSNGKYSVTSQSTFNRFKNQETIGGLFIDGDKDGDLDLYVVNGGNESPENDAIYQDRYFKNDGKGNFSISSNIPKIVTSGKAIAKGDFDGDGDDDLFIGGRVVPGKYPLAANSFLLQNNNGKFINVTTANAPEMEELGLITDAGFSDYDQDGDQDILVVGEWMPLTIFKNDAGKFTKTSLESVTGIGWFYNINQADLDSDGDIDYILGNLGLNNKFGADKEKPFHVFCSDFDDSGNLDIVLSKERKGKFLPVRGRECSSQQMPFIKEKFPTFKSFAEADLGAIYGDDKLSNAVHYTANNFESIVLINNGNGDFTSSSLPVDAQFGPTLSTVIIDVNKDGHMDIIGAGNIYNSEVETLRYDASKGYVLIGDGKGQFTAENNSGFKVDGNVKDIEVITSNEKVQLVVAKNDADVEVFEMME
ncbi:MAG: VCBS repeat-containing protein [Bacteroidia bacterium]|nr:VCBS repeat-containing protein [Bacteroidia bacterium]